MSRTNLTFLALVAWSFAFLQTGADAQGIRSITDTIQFRPEAERLFVEGMKFFQQKEYDSAATVFARTLSEYPRSHRTTGAYIMGGKALYFAGKDKEAIRLLKDFLDLYSFSSYAGDAHYTLGLSYLRARRPEDAATEFLTVRETATEPRLRTRSELLLESLLTETLTTSQLQTLLSEVRTEEMKALLNLRLAEHILRTGDARGAQEVLKPVTGMNPSIRWVGEAISLYERVSKSGSVTIGVVLPLMAKSESGALRQMGVEFLSGVQLALDEYNLTAPVKAKFDIRDTERDPARAAQQVAELCRDDNIQAILGPILSNEVFASAGIANERGVPLVTPTATSNGIAAIGPYIFQANPDFETRGRATAAFAMKTLGARRLAVVSPADGFGRLMADAFSAEVVKRGGEVVGSAWYQAGSTDIRSLLMDLREKAMARLEVSFIDFGGKLKQSELNRIIKWGVNRRILDSLLAKGATADVALLFGPRGKEIADSLKLPVKTERARIDSLGLAVRSIDAIFCPITNSDEIAVVSSQLKLYNFEAQIIGSGEWNDPGALDDNRQYAEGVMFTSDSYYDPASQTSREFAARYSKKNSGRPPTMNSLLAYDAAKMLLGVVERGASRRTDIAAALSSVKGFQGIHSVISMGAGRVNSYLSVLQYRARKIWKIGEIDLAQPEETSLKSENQ